MLSVTAADLLVAEGAALDDVDVGARPELVALAPLAGRSKQTDLKYETIDHSILKQTKTVTCSDI